MLSISRFAKVACVTVQQSKNMVVIDQLLKDLEKQAADLKQNN